MLAMGLVMLPPEPSTLRYRHIESIVDEFSQVSEGKLNYAIACGGAVMLLLEAEEVEGRRIVDEDADNKRRHKDLELYTFGKTFRDLNPNPHDLVVLNEDPFELEKVDYNESVGDVDVGIEILNGSYFDFVLPTEEDTTKIITTHGNEFVTLTPEFLIASKLFSANGSRDEDVGDALALLNRFEIDYDYLARLLGKSEFRNVLAPEELELLPEKIENGILFEEISTRIEDFYGEFVPELENLNYSERLSVLRYNREDLVLTKEQEEFISDNFIRRRRKFTSQPHMDLNNLCMRYIISNFNDPNMLIDKDLDKMYGYLIGKDRHFSVALASGIKQTLMMLSGLNGLEKDELTYDYLSSQIVTKIMNTSFIHVVTSALQKRVEDLVKAEANEHSFYKLVKGI